MRLTNEKIQELRLDAKVLEDIARLIEKETDYAMIPKSLRSIAVDILDLTDGTVRVNAKG